MKLRNKKTGQDGNFIINKDHFECVDLDCVPHYFSLTKLLNDWEDYKPAEPIIKDEKVRKAIMSWYEALPLDGFTDKRILFKYGYFCVGIYHIDCGNYDTLEGIKERFYTIKELCGEEE